MKSTREMHKIIDQFIIGKYLVLKLEGNIEQDFNALVVDGKRYNVVPTYDLKNCFAIESDKKAENNFVECVLLKP